MSNMIAGLQNMGYRVYQSGTHSWMIRIPRGHLIAMSAQSIEIAWILAAMHKNGGITGKKFFRRIKWTA